jgi:hypothetical protein
MSNGLTEQQIQQHIDQLEQQHESTLLQLGRIQGALAVYKAMLIRPPAQTAPPEEPPKEDAPAAG